MNNYVNNMYTEVCKIKKVYNGYKYNNKRDKGS